MNDILEFLSKNSWALSVPISILVAAITWTINIRNRARKGLSWWSETVQALSYSEALKADLVVTFKERRIESLWLSKIKVENTGNVELVESDFIRPLTFQVGEANILSVGFENKNDVSSSIAISCDESSQALLHIVLLNPRERFEFTILTDNSPQISADARVKGISNIQLTRETRIWPSWRLYTALAVSILSWYFVFDSTWRINVIGIVNPILFLITMILLYFEFKNHIIIYLKKSNGALRHRDTLRLTRNSFNGSQHQPITQKFDAHLQPQTR